MYGWRGKRGNESEENPLTNLEMEEGNEAGEH